MIEFTHRRITRGCVVLAFGAVLALAPGRAVAKTTMRLDANVQRSCNLGALPMMFGTVSVLFPNATAQAPIIIECTPNTPFIVAMDDGQNVTGGQRRMARVGAGVGTYLNYEVYRDAGRTLRWGGAGGQRVNGVAPANGKVTLYAYGRTNGLIASGVFQDTITVTIIF